MSCGGRRRHALVPAAGILLLAVVTALAGCSTGTDANTHGGSFQFVSPGGKTVIHYDPPEDRGTIGALRGATVSDPDRTVAVSDYPGEVVVLNVWGQWCGPCRRESPELEKVYQATKDRGVQFIGIDVRDNDREAPKQFLERYGVTYPSIYDPPMRTLGALGGVPTSVVPTTLVLDREHRVAAVFLKSVTAADLMPVVEKVAAEQPVGA